MPAESGKEMGNRRWAGLEGGKKTESMNLGGIFISHNNIYSETFAKFVFGFLGMEPAGNTAVPTRTTEPGKLLQGSFRSYQRHSSTKIPL